MLQISRDELLYQRTNFYETLRNHGIPCSIYSINSSHAEAYDFYKDINTVDNYTDYIDSYMTYEELPKIKTLKSLGWYVEDETLPAIGYVPVLYKDAQGNLAEFQPTYEDKVEIRTNIYDSNTSTRSFLIKDFLGNGFPNVIYYTVKLVPYRVDN